MFRYNRVDHLVPAMCRSRAATPGCYQVQAGRRVGKRADHAGSPPDLAHDPFQRVVCPQLHPMAVRESVVGQGFPDMGVDEVRRAHKTLAAEFIDDGPGFRFGGGPVLLGVDRLQHMADLAHLGRRHLTEDIAVEMHDTALPAGLRQILGYALDQAPASVRGDQLDTLEPAVEQMAQEPRPAGLVLLGPLADAQNLAITPR